MPDIRVQDEKGTVHVFPDGSTPEMISDALGLANPYSEKGADANPPKAPVPLPRSGGGDESINPSPLAKNQPIFLSSPVAPLGSAALSASRFIGGIAAGSAANYAGDSYGLNPYLRDAISVGAGVLGSGGAGALEDATPSIKDAIGLRLRNQGRINPDTGVATPGALKSFMKIPGIKGVANAVVPDNPNPIGYNMRIPGVVETPEEAQVRLQKISDDAKYARDQAFAKRGDSMMKRQAYQDSLDAAKTKADNALARSQRSTQTQQGQSMANEIEYNKELSRQATEAADQNRQKDLQSQQDEDQRVQDLHDQFQKSLEDLESSRQKQLSDRGRLNDQFASALNRRGGTPLQGAISGDSVQGNPTPFGRPSEFTGNDLISRTRQITIPGDEPTPGDLKRAGDLTQAPLAKLQTLAKFGDKLAQNEINRRLKN